VAGCASPDGYGCRAVRDAAVREVCIRLRAEGGTGHDARAAGRRAIPQPWRQDGLARGCIRACRKRDRCHGCQRCGKRDLDDGGPNKKGRERANPKRSHGDPTEEQRACPSRGPCVRVHFRRESLEMNQIQTRIGAFDRVPTCAIPVRRVLGPASWPLQHSATDARSEKAAGEGRQPCVVSHAEDASPRRGGPAARMSPAPLVGQVGSDDRCARLAGPHPCGRVAHLYCCHCAGKPAPALPSEPQRRVSAITDRNRVWREDFPSSCWRSRRRRTDQDFGIGP